MAKRKKVSKLEQRFNALIAEKASIIDAAVSRKLEALETKTRYDFSHYNAVISAQTDRIGKQNGQVDQMVRQVNHGFEQVKKDLIRAGQGLTAHERDIANLQQRIFALETAATAKKGKR